MPADHIDATYKVVTPLFCGGANPTTAEVRLPSFKGVLRWWWRALVWSRFGGDFSKIVASESALFGSTRSGQGKIVMRLLPSGPPTVIEKDRVLEVGGDAVGPGARYLGYGIMKAFTRGGNHGRAVARAGQLSRACIQAPLDVKIALRARDLNETERASLLDALKAIGVLGGMGAKSRKGYGSLVLRSLTLNGTSQWTPPTSATELRNVIEQLVKGAGTATAERGALAPYTALSSRTRIVLASADAPIKPLTLLDRVGREMMRFRSWGHNGKVLGADSEKNFADDHDLMKKPVSQRSAHPRRIVFGLPHNYGESSELQVGPNLRDPLVCFLQRARRSFHPAIVAAERGA